MYNSFQAEVDKRFSHGVTVSANYTWSRSIDAVSIRPISVESISSIHMI